jgi:translation initiation factor IF-3
VTIISTKTRINEKIRAREVRVISDTGEQLGVMSSREAYNIAMEKKLDLVEVSPTAKPPVCKIMDFGKYKYEQARKAKEAKKNQKQTDIKEIKFKARIDVHDFETKIGKIRKFLEKDNKVKASLMLFGREKMHAELGIKKLDEVAEIFKDEAIIDKKYGGPQKFIILSPLKK